MNRWRKLLVCVGIAVGGCQDPATSLTAQELDDCTPGANFCKAVMPPVPYWQGQLPPLATANQTYEALWDANGEFVVALADTGHGKIVWAVRVKKPQVGELIASVAERGPIDGTRPPPPPPPPVIDPRVLLERALRHQQLAAEAADAVAQCSGK